MWHRHRNHIQPQKQHGCGGFSGFAALLLIARYVWSTFHLTVRFSSLWAKPYELKMWRFCQRNEPVQLLNAGWWRLSQTEGWQGARRSGRDEVPPPVPDCEEITEPRLVLGLEAGLQAVKRACWAGGSSWFTGIDGEIDATVNGVVILVGGRGLAGVLAPPPGGIVVRVVNERDAGGGVVYPKLGVSHEVVDGWSWVWFFQAFIEGATECIHHADLPWRKGERAQWEVTSRERIEGLDGEGETLAVVVRRVGGEEEEEVREQQEKRQLQSALCFHIRCLQLTRF